MPTANVMLVKSDTLGFTSCDFKYPERHTIHGLAVYSFRNTTSNMNRLRNESTANANTQTLQMVFVETTTTRNPPDKLKKLAKE